VRFARIASLFVVGTLSALVGCSSDSSGGVADTGEVDTGVSTFRPDDGVDTATGDTSPADTATADTAIADSGSADATVSDAADAAKSDAAADASDTATADTAADASGPKTVDVTVGPGGGTSFSPSTVTIKVGDTVRWTWGGTGHNVVSGTGGVADNKFCSPSDTGCATAATSTVGAVYSHTFTTAGTYPYFCAPHASFGMTGSVTVN
jgi:plastocyanin